MIGAPSDCGTASYGLCVEQIAVRIHATVNDGPLVVQHGLAALVGRLPRLRVTFSFDPIATAPAYILK